MDGVRISRYNMRHQNIPCRDTLFNLHLYCICQQPYTAENPLEVNCGWKVDFANNQSNITSSHCQRLPKKKKLIIRQYLTSLERSSLVTADNIWLAANAQYSEFTICFKLKMSWSSWVRAWSSWYGGGAVVLGGSDCPLSRAAERMQRMLAKEWSVMSSILQRETTSSCQTLLSLGVSIEDIRFWIVSERRARCPESLQD